VRHLAIQKKINDVIEYTTARGGFERVTALRDFRFPYFSRSLFPGPVLVLLAENEADILVPSSPTLKMFSDNYFGNCWPRQHSLSLAGIIILRG